MPELVFLRQGQEVLRFVLDGPRVVLGRGEDCDVVIPDPQVSQHQVALLREGERWRVEDLSGQGTRVAGQVLQRGKLEDGADLQLGPWIALFRLRGTAGPEGSARGASTDVKPLEAVEEHPQRAQLRVKRGSTEQLYPLTAARFTVGKGPDNAVVIADRFISTRHLEVTRCELGFHVRDLNSTNGTFLDGVRVLAVELPLNHTLRVGETELHFEPVPASPGEQSLHGIVGADPAMRKLLERVRRAADSEAVVMVLGESGTGKELVARALHEYSPRAAQPFVPVNCAALSPALIESELFGHEKGAFTGADSKHKGAFEEADGGTLFLDEVGELPLELQAKLLRVLETGELKPVGASRPFHVRVRVVAATHRDLRAHARQGRFREDLYYRLSMMPLVLPPLRSRRGDIRLLAEHFVQALGPEEQPVKFTAAALAQLQKHSWPGNIRELRNVVCRALLMRQGPKIDARDLSFEDGYHHAPEDGQAPELELPEGVTLEQMMERVERQLIENTLRRCGNHKDQAAKKLGMARSSLFERLKRWGITQGQE
ncbi:MAG: sigma 54-interacting transcriptional regulator [Hyalangium sp.]|uniref:sigma 54-interacting transcriptional regulator n=1 Tax=Hyalangium sp. TaxID=2028555 RepID=UPI00389B19AF